MAKKTTKTEAPKLTLIRNVGNTPAPETKPATTARKTTKPEAAKTGKPKADKPAKAKKVSALDAAAQVLAKNREPMNCQEMIEAMAKAKLWESPGGKTPHATLYSAILREIGLKGKDARFKKTERGKFAAK